jgi:molybdopterin-guanine dinucleotide biosynthesis protein A
VIDCVVLAGTGKASALTIAENVKNKAFIEINGRTLLDYSLEALRAVSRIGRIAVVGPESELKSFTERYRILTVPEAGSILENIFAGFNALKPTGYFLVVAADIPLLSALAVEDFIDQCSPYQLDFYYPIIGREDNERRFPGVTRTYVKVKEGVFTGGNLFLVNSDKVKEGLPLVNKFIEMRKSPIKLAAILGFSFIVKYLSRRLTIRELENRVSILLGIRGMAVISRYPEIGTDVDKPSDLEIMRRELSPPL